MTKKTTRARAEAKRLMWEYYSNNKKWLPNWIREYREEVLAAIMMGEEPSIVFLLALKNEQCDTDSTATANHNF